VEFVIQITKIYLSIGVAWIVQLYFVIVDGNDKRDGIINSTHTLMGGYEVYYLIKLEPNTNHFNSHGFK
jgi:hypothetical protein